MRDTNFRKFGIVLSGLILLILLAACATVSTAGPQAAPTVTANPANPTTQINPSPTTLKDIAELKDLIKNPQPDPTPKFPQPTQAALPTSTTATAKTQAVTQNSATTRPCASMAVDYYQYSLDERLKQADQIFIGEIVKIDPFIWNTPDGKAPADPCVSGKYNLPEYAQFAPVHITVSESFKGNLAPNSTIVLLIPDFPGTLPAVMTPRIIIPEGQPVIWFLVNETDYRLENTQSNLTNLSVLEALSQKTDGSWSGGIASVRLTNIDELKEKIKNPPPTATPTQK